MANTIRTYTRYATSTDTIDIKINSGYNQIFAGAKYYSNGDFAEANAVIPTGGTIAITGRPNGTGGYGSLDNAVTSGEPLNCTEAGNVLSTNIPLDAIKCVPASIVGATHYKITVSAKEM